MGVPDDANPLNRRLPAEVVSRRRKVEKQGPKEETPLTIDRAQVLQMKPEQRVKWLTKALQGGQEGRVTPNAIYDVVAHTKFASDLPDKVGARMYRMIHANVGIFSAKQQRYLDNECKLAQLFGQSGATSSANTEALKQQDKSRPDEFTENRRQAQDQGDDSDLEGGSTTAMANGSRPAAAPGSGGAAGSRRAAPSGVSPEIPALWDKLTKLTAAERAQAVDSLDSVTKERLEEFLVNRIGSRSDSRPSPAAAAPAPEARADAGGGEGSSASGSASPSGSRNAAGGRSAPNASPAQAPAGDVDGSGAMDASREKNAKAKDKLDAKADVRVKAEAKTESKADVKAKDGKRKDGRGRRVEDDGGGARRGARSRRRGRSTSGSASRRSESSESSGSSGASRKRRRRSQRSRRSRTRSRSRSRKGRR